MKNKKEIEGNIRLNAAIIYLIVGLACCSIVFYLYTLRGNIEEQKMQIEQHRKTLVLTHRLIYSVSQVQSAGSLYISTNAPKYLSLYKKKMSGTALILDSISNSVNAASSGSGLRKLDSLLKKQMHIVYELGGKLAGSNPLDTVNRRLKSYPAITKRDSVLITTVQQDTVLNAAPKKGFFRRLWNVVSPKKDSVLVLSNRKFDTLHVTRPDTLAILSEIDSVVRVAGEGYYQNIRDIGVRVGSLAASDQKIMEQISTLLLGMYASTLDSILVAVDESERIIGRNYVYSIVGGGIALVLVLVLIAVIISGVNKAKQVRESRHKLLLSVSHDLKTPLHSIMGYLQLLRDGGHDVRSMLSSGNYILSLWENLIEFSSIERGQLNVNLSGFSLSEFFETITGMFEPLASRKGIDFTCVADFNKTQLVETDQLKLKQIVANLISNGIKYTVQGGVSLEVSLQERLLVCKVSDTGAGIPEADQAKIFAPFRRVEKNNKLAEGTGLGLFVVKEFTELLGGKLEFFSLVGHGSVFTVTIPVNLAEPEETFRPGASLRITVIDDDAVLLGVTARMLTSLGHRVTTVNDVARIEACDFILADMEMGSFTGMDVLRQAGGTPVVIMTARSGFTLKKAREAGFADYLSKPFTLRDLEKIFGNAGVPDDWQDLFGNDVEYMNETLEAFSRATAEHKGMLQEALRNNDYLSARKVCHKMLPMFSQLGYTEVAELLKKVEDHLDEEYEGWRTDVEAILSRLLLSY